MLPRSGRACAPVSKEGASVGPLSVPWAIWRSISSSMVAKGMTRGSSWLMAVAMSSVSAAVVPLVARCSIANENMSEPLPAIAVLALPSIT